MRRLILLKEYKNIKIGDEFIFSNNDAHFLIERGFAKIKEAKKIKNKMITKESHGSSILRTRNSRQYKNISRN